ncbi:MAG: hypothetical protein ABSE55_13420 [Terracidiphilus sp.]
MPHGSAPMVEELIAHGLELLTGASICADVQVAQKNASANTAEICARP